MVTDLILYTLSYVVANQKNTLKLLEGNRKTLLLKDFQNRASSSQQALKRLKGLHRYPGNRRMTTFKRVKTIKMMVGLDLAHWFMNYLI